MKHDYRVEWNRIILSPLDGDDFESLRVLRNRERKWFKSSEEVSSSQQKKWQESYLGLPGDYMFKIALTGSPEDFIGAVGIYNTRVSTGQGEFGRLVIDREMTGNMRGLGLDATIAVLDVAFSQMSLSEVYLEVLNENIAAIKTYERAGFEHLEDDGQIKRMTISKQSFIRHMNNTAT